MGLAKPGKYAKMDAVLFREKTFHPRREYLELSAVFADAF